jgi:2'-5' RNA ligase
MRTFFALEPDAEKKLQIANWRDKSLPGLDKAVPSPNFHVTLAFLGEIDAGALDRLCLQVDNWMSTHPVAPGHFSLEQMGYWPHAQIAWLGPAQWPSDLDKLTTKLRHIGHGVGAKSDKKRFQPHITLARHCTTPPPAALLPPSIDLDYRHFALFESVRGRQGVHYQVLAKWDMELPLQRPRRKR